MSPKFSKLLRRVSEVLKFVKVVFLKFKVLFLSKRETRGLELRSACSCELAKQSRPLISLYIPKSPRTLEAACLSASALHAIKNSSKS